MAQVDFMTHERHFFDHLAPMYLALPPAYQGIFYVRQPLIKHAAMRGIPAQAYGPNRSAIIPQLRTRQASLLVAAASGDLKAAHQAGRKCVFTQHGGGQSFRSIHSSYAGYSGHKNVFMFLHPGDHPAMRDRQAYGNDKLIRVVGCPKLDPWHDGSLPQPENDVPVVVFSTHWDCKVVPETRSAFWHMIPALDELAGRNGKDFKLYGHGHPRMLGQITHEYRKRGIEVIDKFEDVMAMADVYIMDHMSTLYEFASAGRGGWGRPVIVMNMPLYRRKVDHGLRFWSAANVGCNVDQPEHMIEAVELAFSEDDEMKVQRIGAVHQVFKYTDGECSARAAKAIVEAAEMFKTRAPVSLTRRNYARRQRKTKMDHSQQEQIPLIALVRLRNFNRGFSPRGRRIAKGIDARPNRLFWTDELHSDQLIKGQKARIATGDEYVKFPGTAEQPVQIEKLDESAMPEFLMVHNGGGYYDISEDGQVIDQQRGKLKTEMRVKELQDAWRSENLGNPQEDTEDIYPLDVRRKTAQ